jgi:hypothetical protein
MAAIRFGIPGMCHAFLLKQALKLPGEETLCDKQSRRIYNELFNAEQRSAVGSA